MKNSDNSPRFSWLQVIGVVTFLILVVAAAARFFYASGYLLYFGDAQAHLNISRAVIDSRTPGYGQLGTVWLPVLHLICLPFVVRASWWQNGLAGTLPVAACFVMAGVCLYLCGKHVYASSTAALIALLCFALNPNVLYLATITMTEIVFVAGLAACLLALLSFRVANQYRYFLLAIAASWWMSLTRYDGWFLIPFVALFLARAASRRKLRMLIVSGSMASLAPIYWMAHNWWLSGNALDFYNGPYSAAAIQGDRSYPGFHNWPQAIRYYWEAGRLCCGDGLLVVGIAGLLVTLWKGRWLAASFLILTPLFYVWSIHSSETPIHVPSLWPFSYYNTRYGLAVVVLLAFAAGAVVIAVPHRLRFLGFLLPLISVSPWITDSTPMAGIVWKESQVNSDSRRAWTSQAASYLGQRLKPGDGVLVEFGDLLGVLCRARIPIREALHEGNGPMWFANTMPTGLLRQTEWAVAQADDQLARRIQQADSFAVVTTISVPKAPALLIYERRHFGVTH